ncbi:DUF6428 family protein [Bacteroidia bacterium]|nr:DUF6428 family protein [Bacteroidia bacterium]
MKLSQLQNALTNMDEVHFTLPNGNFVPRHYHLTEIGLATKSFIDCGGKRHEVKKVTLQLWTSTDYDHRLKSDKFLNIITTSLPLFDGEDLDVEVEFQTDTISKFDLGYNGHNLEFIGTKTDCLATELCGIDAVHSKSKLSLADIGKAMDSSCTPGGGCC